MEMSSKLNEDKTKKTRKRLFFLFIVCSLLLIGLLVKIAHIQVFQNSYYQRFAQGQIEQSVIVPAVRGQIYDRNSKVIVDNRPSYSLMITPAYLPKAQDDRKKLLNYLSEKLSINKKTLLSKIKIKNRRTQNKYKPILIKRDLSQALYTELKENESILQGVSIELMSARRYLLGESMAHVLGHTGIIDRKAWQHFQNVYKETPENNPYRYQNTIIGKLGIERNHDKDLKGKDGLATRLINSKGQPISDTIKIISKPTAGHNISLTIDSNLQREAKKMLKNKIGALIATNPQTGEILAIVSNPSFNPNDIISRDLKTIKRLEQNKSKLFFNRAIHATYPPSSIFKLIVATAALEEDKVNLKKKVNCKGAYPLGNRVFKCHKVHGRVNLIEAIEKSCNTYFYSLALDIGWDLIYKYAALFNLSHTHKLEFGESAKGILPTAQWKRKQFLETWYSGDTLNHSIGQGYIILSPIQIHNIISIIATNGTLYKPYIIDQIEDPVKNKIKYKAQKEIIKQIVFKDKTIKVLKKALRSVVTRGTGYYARFSKKHLILGKTGTAQTSHEYDHAWFTAYAKDTNDSNNKIAISIIIENAQNRGGGFVSAPIATALIRYYLENTPISVTQRQMGRLLYEEDKLLETNDKLTLKANIETKDTIVDIVDNFLKHEDNILEKLNTKHITLRKLFFKDERESTGLTSKDLLSSVYKNYTDTILNEALLSTITKEQKDIEKEKILLLEKKNKVLQKQKYQQDILAAKEKAKEKQITFVREAQERTIEKKVEKEKRKQTLIIKEKSSKPEDIEFKRLSDIVNKERKQFIKDTDDLEFLD